MYRTLCHAFPHYTDMVPLLLSLICRHFFIYNASADTLLVQSYQLPFHLRQRHLKGKNSLVLLKTVSPEDYKKNRFAKSLLRT